MALIWPNYPENVGGDEPTAAPTKNDRGLLGAERGTQFARRIETDSDRNLFVHVAVDDVAPPRRVSALAGNGITAVTNGTLSTILTYTATAERRITRMSVSGTTYAKYQIFLDTVLVETKRSGPDRSLDFTFNSAFGMDVGQVLDVKVTHYGVGVLADFESTIYGA